MKKRLLTIFLFPFLLLTGCDSVSSTKRPTSIYNEEPLSLLWDSDSSSLREWYKTHDFTMYSTCYNMMDYPFADYHPQGYGIILIHSAKYDYSYFAMYLNEKATGSSYAEPHEELYVGKTKEHYLLVGDLSYHNEYQGGEPLYYYFLESISFFKKCDPGYKEKFMEKYGNQYPEPIKQMQRDGYLYSFIDHETPKEVYSEGETIENPYPCEVEKYKYTSGYSGQKIDFKIKNYPFDYGCKSELNNNEVNYHFEFKNNLPRALTRHVQYNTKEEINRTSGYDMDIVFKYDKLPSDPMSLLKRKNTYKDKTKLLINHNELYNPKLNDIEVSKESSYDISNMEPVDHDYDYHGYKYDYAPLASCFVNDLGDYYEITPNIGFYRSVRSKIGYSLDNDGATITYKEFKKKTMVFPTSVRFLYPYALELPIIAIKRNLIPNYDKSTKDIYLPSSIVSIESGAFDEINSDTIIHLETDYIPSGFEEGWTPYPENVVLNDKPEGEFYIDSLSILFNDDFYYQERINDKEYLFSLKKKNGEHVLLSYTSKSILINKKDNYDLSEIGIYNLSGDKWYYSIYQIKPIMIDALEFFRIIPKQNGNEISFKIFINEPYEQDVIYDLDRTLPANPPFCFKEAIFNYEDDSKDKVDLGTNRFYSTSNDVSLYSFRTKKKLKSVTFNHASSSYYSVPSITYSV